ncbi:MAG: NADH-dependent dehydrogenase [Isosphaeraceae bacterium]|nr:MAG: NADH-dependent dehydrogenase [Isosphaeraceae bacterium]
MRTPKGSSGPHRREFLGSMATAGAAAALFPTIVPASALGRGGAVAPSERIVLGAIGLGPRGEFDLKWMLPHQDVQFVAICDVRKSRREAIKAIADQHYGNSDCKMYHDMKEFLDERKDIDAVLIATGDRWHAPAAIYAMRAGKDVYSEKPSCMSIREGRKVVEVARETGRIYQTGVQRLSEEPFVMAILLAQSGKLGKVHTVRAHIAPWDDAYMRRDWLPAQPLPPKEEVDWDAWLGPCPARPYNAEYVNGGWRGHYDFHTSCIGEWGAHTFAQGQAGINCLNTSPVLYHFVDNESGDGMVTEFACGTRMILQREGWKGSCGMTFEGDEGTASCADGYKETEVSSPALLEEGKKLVAEYKEKTGRALDHVRNFFDCVKSRQQPVANAEVMHHSMATVHAANLCMWLRTDLEYDPEKEIFPKNEQANLWLDRSYRHPWTV